MTLKCLAAAESFTALFQGSNFDELLLSKAFEQDSLLYTDLQA